MRGPVRSRRGSVRGSRFASDGSDLSVDGCDEPVEESRVEEPGEGVPGLGGRERVEGLVDALARSGFEGPHGERAQGCVRGDLEQRRRGAEGPLGRDVGEPRRLVRVARKLDVAEVQDGRDDLEDLVDFALAEPDDAHGGDRGGVLLRVVDLVELERVRRRQVAEGARARGQAQRLAAARRGAGAELVEDVVRALGRAHRRHARALQQVGRDACAADAPERVKLNLHVLAKPRRVVVARRLGVAKGLEERVRLEHLLLDGSRSARGHAPQQRVAGRPRDGGGGGGRGDFATPHRPGARKACRSVCEILHDELCGFGFSGAGLARDQDGLGRLVGKHAGVGLLGDGVHVRRQVAQRSAAVLGHHARAVETTQLLVRVDRDQHGTGKGVDRIQSVPSAQRVQNARLVQEIGFDEIVHRLIAAVLVPSLRSRNRQKRAGRKRRSLRINSSRRKRRQLDRQRRAIRSLSKRGGGGEERSEEKGGVALGRRKPRGLERWGGLGDERRKEPTGSRWGHGPSDGEAGGGGAGGWRESREAGSGERASGPQGLRASWPPGLLASGPPGLWVFRPEPSRQGLLSLPSPISHLPTLPSSPTSAGLSLIFLRGDVPSDA